MHGAHRQRCTLHRRFVTVTDAAVRSRSLVFWLAFLSLVSFGCSKPGPTKDEVLSRANEAFAAEQYGQAEKAYREVLRLVPTDPVALRQLGIIYFDQGQYLQ